MPDDSEQLRQASKSEDYGKTSEDYRKISIKIDQDLIGRSSRIIAILSDYSGALVSSPSIDYWVLSMDCRWIVDGFVLRVYNSEE
jgi:hypothetical protein